MPIEVKYKIRKSSTLFVDFFQKVLKFRCSMRGKNCAYIVKNFVAHEEAAPETLKNLGYHFQLNKEDLFLIKSKQNLYCFVLEI